MYDGASKAWIGAGVLSRSKELASQVRLVRADGAFAGRVVDEAAPGMFASLTGGARPVRLEVAGGVRGQGTRPGSWSTQSAGTMDVTNAWGILDVRVIMMSFLLLLATKEDD
jgi:hypothetical protein